MHDRLSREDLMFKYCVNSVHKGVKYVHER